MALERPTPPNPPLPGTTPPDLAEAEAAALVVIEATPAASPEDDLITAWSADQAAGKSAWRANLRRPLDFLLTQQLTRPVTLQQVSSLRAFWLDGLYGSAGDALTLSYIPLFAVAYGAAAGQVGVLASVGNLLGALALFPGARLLEKLGRSKPLILWSSTVLYRLPLLLLALLPFLPGGATVAIPAIVVLYGIRAFGVNLANPAWTALTAELVPTFMRGRYFSLRNLLMGIATLVATPLAGWMIARLTLGGSAPLFGYQVVFILSLVLGLVATWYFAQIHEPAEMRMRVAGRAHKSSVLELLRGNRALFGFVVNAFVWNMALQVAAPYFNVYLVTRLGGDAGTVGVVTSISALTALLGQVLFGRLMDRKGAVWVFLATGFPIVVLPMAWAFYTDAFQVGINNLFGGFLWAGFNLANFNLLLLLTPDNDRARAVALYQTAVFAGAVIGPMIGGYLADNVSFPLVFLVSGAGRLIAMVFFVFFGLRAALSRERLAQASE